MEGFIGTYNCLCLCAGVGCREGTRQRASGVRWASQRFIEERGLGLRFHRIWRMAIVRRSPVGIYCPVLQVIRWKQFCPVSGVTISSAVPAGVFRRRLRWSAGQSGRTTSTSGPEASLTAPFRPSADYKTGVTRDCVGGRQWAD